MPRHSRRLALPGLLVAALLANAAPLAAQTTLRYKHREGEVLNYVMDQKITMTLMVNNQVIVVNVNAVADIAQRIHAVDKDGTSRQTMRVGRLRMTVEGDGKKIEYDSQNGKLPEGPEGAAFEGLKAITQHAISMTVDVRGAVSALDIPKELLDAMNNVKGGLGMQWSEDEFRRIAGQANVVFPKEAVKRGSSWKDSISLKMPMMDLTMDTKHIYEGPVRRGDHQLEQIALLPTITLKPGADAPKDLNFKMTESKGTLLFDNVGGRMVETNMTVGMLIEVGQDNTVRMLQTVTFKWKR